MSRRVVASLSLLALGLVVVAPLVPASPPAIEELAFIQFVDHGDEGAELQTSITTLADGDGREVVLYSAVHIGDGAYYEALMKHFDSCDALLYELVAPKNTRPKKSDVGRSLSFITMFQRMLQRMLKLDFQLDGIDYSKKNFVHADMSPREFAASQKKKGESLLTIMFRVYVTSIQRELSGKGSQITPANLAKVFESEDQSRELKILFAKEMSNIEGMLAGFEGPDGESTIVTERNKVCIEVLEEQLEIDDNRRLGIFYGGAHMPDMIERVAALGFEVKKHEWVTAWDCRVKKKANEKPEGKAEKKPEKKTADL